MTQLPSRAVCEAQSGTAAINTGQLLLGCQARLEGSCRADRMSWLQTKQPWCIYSSGGVPSAGGCPCSSGSPWCSAGTRLESLAQEEARMRGRMLGSLSRYQAGRQAGAVTPALCQVPDTVGETCSHSHDWAAQGSDLRKQPGDGYRDRV